MSLLLDKARPLTPVMVWGLPMAVLAGLTAVVLLGVNEAGFLALNRHRLPDRLWALFTTMGDSLTAFCLLLAVARRRPDIAAAGLIAAVFATLFTQAPKHLLDVARPAAVLGDAVHVIGPLLKHNAFPSGHTASAFVMLALAAAFLRHRSWFLILLPLAALVGISRIAVGAHWPADVLAGAGVGWVAGMTGVWLAQGMGLKSLNLWAKGFLLLAAIYYLTGYDSRQPGTDSVEKAIALAALLAYFLPAGALLRTPMTTRCAVALLASVCALLTIWRLWSRQHAGVELFFDEAYYWGWAQNLDWGYYSKPPMVAWLIHLGTELFGDRPSGIRAGAALLYPLTAGWVFLITRRLYAGDPQANTLALAAGVAFITLPVVGFGQWFMTTDAPLLFFGAFAIWAWLRAQDRNHWGDWLLLGLALGLGALSKYTMVFFALGMGLHLMTQADRWERLRNPRLWLAGLVALIILAPNLAWNAAHQFASFKHTAEISHVDQAGLRPQELAAFASAQFGLMGPVLMLTLAVALLLPSTWRDPRRRVLALFVAPSLVFFCALALTTRAFANWAAFAFVAAAPLVTIVLWREGRRHWFVLALLLNLGLTTVAFHWQDLARVAGKTLVRKTNPYHRVQGWHSLGRELAQELEAHPHARLAGEHRDILAQMAFYGGPRAAHPLMHNPTGRIRSHYDLVADIASQPKGEFLFVTTSDEPPLKLFREGELLRIAEVRLTADLTRRLSIWRVRDYAWGRL
jgi:4-amino-4-deoxy-L-arabinose transferase-like glycosyltransferase